MNFIYLSYSLSSKISRCPTDPNNKIKVKKNISDIGSLLHSFKMGTHSGIHHDTPAYVNPYEKKVDDFNPKDFTSTTVKVDKRYWSNVNSISSDIDEIIYDSGWHKILIILQFFIQKKDPQSQEK